jgi:hypothetical protein
MVDVMAVLARKGVSQLKRKYFGWGIAEEAQTAFAALAVVAFVEVSLEDCEIFLKLFGFVTVVNVVKVLEAEEIFLEKVVDPSWKCFLHVLNVADGVVHEVQLAFENQEIIEEFVLVDYFFVVVDFDERHFVVDFDAFVGPSADGVAAKVEVVLGLVRHLNSLAGHVLVAEVFASVVAEVAIVADSVQALGESLVAFAAGLLLGAEFVLVVEGVTAVFEHFHLVLELL